MPRVVVIVLLLFLIGCESDYQKCLNTEIPKAQELLVISDSQKLQRFIELMTRLELIKIPSREKIEWEKINAFDNQPFPENYDSKADFEAAWTEFIESSDGEEFVARERERLPERLKKAGFLGDTFLEQAEKFSAFEEELNEALQERAYSLNCFGYGNEDCAEPLYRETEHLSDGEWRGKILDVFVDVAPRALSESIAMLEARMEAQIEASGAAVLKLAANTCNSNGLYE